MQKKAQIIIQKKVIGEENTEISKEMDRDYYEVGYIISGGRKIITPTQIYNADKGMVGITYPYIYHNTVAISKGRCECIMIRFTSTYVDPLINEVGSRILDQLNEEKLFSFSENGQKKILKLFMEMKEEYEKKIPYREFILQGMLFRLLFAIYEEKLSVSNVVTNRVPVTPPVLETVAYMENHFMDNPTLEEAAAVAGFSAAYFSRLFSAQMGQSYTEYLDGVKIRHAKILLTHTKKTIMEIAEETGYCHGNYLNTQFKKKVGMTPGQYRKKNREQI